MFIPKTESHRLCNPWPFVVGTIQTFTYPGFVAQFVIWKGVKSSHHQELDRTFSSLVQFTRATHFGYRPPGLTPIWIGGLVEGFPIYPPTRGKQIQIQTTDSG